MKGWAMVDTARCARCRIFTPTGDLAFAGDGTTYCRDCGPPSSEAADEWVVVARPAYDRRSPLTVAAAAVAITVFGFFVAACVSQL